MPSLLDRDAITGGEGPLPRAPLVQTAPQPTSEQAHQLAAGVGRGLLDRRLELDWLQRDRNRRAIDVTERGRQGLAETSATTLA